MELLGDDGLSRIGSKLRRRELEERRVLDALGLGYDSVAKADIDLDGQTRPSDPGFKRDPDALVFIVSRAGSALASAPAKPSHGIRR